MATTVSNKVTLMLTNASMTFATNSFRLILMASGFVFNEDTHDGYADVSASELAAGNGYTATGVALTGIAITEDDTDNRTEITWANASWTASGGAIGPTPGAILYDDTVTTPTADPILGYIDFGGNQTQAAGGVLTISGLEFRIGKAAV